ncbi:sensor histidine kinase [Clostridium folliculivorans]|uniref:histidine kinase n=1 Tax=Clostridium folliculivorans TaxID=2886038 RepID=A0A9W6DCI3_9CLOT|nr:HAMP domain-containing sensor histidine kinase [Clostridium folliculivorans]GKU27344.1 two-component sensor histidine kinase [Clostridium folliculivorans]GKU32195.1 two-component sensor histidine kinase [Clostridium folliculivorans]
MIELLLFIILILLIIIVLLALKNLKIKKDIKYISSICEDISSNNTNLRIKVTSSNRDVKKLCQSINHLINEFHKLQISDYESRESMKKMLSNVSHDLRTPLTVMLGYIDQINYNKNISESGKTDYLLKLGAKTNEVIELINKFFTLAKLESGDKEIVLDKINISETLREIVLNFYSIISEKNLSMEVSIPDTDIYCYANKDAIERILNNLISNSLKYGYEGTSIGVSLYEEANVVWIEEWDNGKGINSLEKDKVFQRLYTIEDSRNKDYSGSGLGLTIVQTLVKRMNGDVFLESYPFKKTTFKFYLNK